MPQLALSEAMGDLSEQFPRWDLNRMPKKIDFSCRIQYLVCRNLVLRRIVQHSQTAELKLTTLILQHGLSDETIDFCFTSYHSLFSGAM